MYQLETRFARIKYKNTEQKHAEKKKEGLLVRGNKTNCATTVKKRNATHERGGYLGQFGERSRSPHDVVETSNHVASSHYVDKICAKLLLKYATPLNNILLSARLK